MTQCPERVSLWQMIATPEQAGTKSGCQWFLAMPARPHHFGPGPPCQQRTTVTHVDNTCPSGTSASPARKEMVIMALRAVVIGAGWAAEGYIIALGSLGVDVVALCGRSLEPTRALAGRYRIKDVRDEWRNAIVSLRPDIVCVATHASPHVDMVLAAVDATLRWRPGNIRAVRSSIWMAADMLVRHRSTVWLAELWVRSSRTSMSGSTANRTMVEHRVMWQ
jgi:hypothetical protein